MSSKKSPEEGLYSRVTRRIWKSPDFLALSKPKPSGRELWLRLLIAPEADRIPGLFEAYDVTLARALDWPLKDFERCWKEIASRGMAHADWSVGLVWVPKSLKHNFPPNPNNVLGWKLSWKELPGCPLKERAREAMVSAFAQKDVDAPPARGIGWAQAFAEVTGNGGTNPATNVPGGGGGNVPPNGGGTREREREQEREIPPAPTPRKSGGRRDPFAASFGSVSPAVTRVHEAWRLATGLAGHKLRGGAADLDAVTLAEAIELHGEADCLLVAAHCMRDGMVNGAADDRGQDHRSIRYVFGNATTFARVLELARKATAGGSRADADAEFEAAMGAGA